MVYNRKSKSQVDEDWGYAYFSDPVNGGSDLERLGYPYSRFLFPIRWGAGWSYLVFANHIIVRNSQWPWLRNRWRLELPTIYTIYKAYFSGLCKGTPQLGNHREIRKKKPPASGLRSLVDGDSGAAVTWPARYWWTFLLTGTWCEIFEIDKMVDLCGVEWCLMTLDGVSWCLMILSGVKLCLMILNGV